MGVKAKHILTFKLILALVFMAGISFALFGKVGLIAGVCGAIVVVGCIDKDLSSSLFKEWIGILGAELFVIIAAIFGNMNYYGLVIGALIVGLVINHLHIYYKKMPRTMGFLYLYMFLTYLKVPVVAYRQLVPAVVVSSILTIVVYYLLTRKMFFKKDKKQVAPVNKEDVEYINFKYFKLRFTVLTSILFTLAIFVMRYFYAEHGLWLAITVIVVTQPDRVASVRKVVHRIIGTIIGAIVFVGFLSFVHTDFKYVIYVLFVVSIYFMLYPMKHYAVQAVFITFFALSLDSVFYNTQTHLFLGGYRILFTLIGCILILGLFMAERGIEKVFNMERAVG